MRCKVHYKLNIQGLYICKDKVLKANKTFVNSNIKMVLGASLVVHWLGVCLPMRGTRVRALVWEDPICRGATGPVSHNY